MPPNYDRCMHHPADRHAAWRSRKFRDWHDYEQRTPMFNPSRSFRVVAPAVIALILQVPAAIFWPVYTRSFTLGALITLALAILGPLALLAARRYPGPVVAIVTVFACTDFILVRQNEGPPYVALAFAIVSAIARGARVWAWVSVGVAWAVTLTIGIIAGLAWHPARVAITTLVILIIFGIGEGFRTRRDHYEEYRRAYAQRRQSEVQAERVRIARELHDVLAHSLSQINVQASVGLHLMDKQPGKAAEALASIKETSKTALDEVRSVLGVLRAEQGQDPSAPLVPEPDLSRLPGLAASVTSQGVDVTLTNDLADVPKAVQLAIYRIVQESLTNVVRHAGATRAEVFLRSDKGSYVVTIADDGRGLGEHPSEGGRGMLGMRERAELLGGTLDTGSSPLGGLLVTARIPETEAEKAGRA